MKIYVLVEGHGEVEAVPVLLRRLLVEAQCYGTGVGPPIRRTQSQLRSQQGIQAWGQACTASTRLRGGGDPV